jgi:hypothetical protein
MQALGFGFISRSKREDLTALPREFGGVATGEASAFFTASSGIARRC